MFFGRLPIIYIQGFLILTYKDSGFGSQKGTSKVALDQNSGGSSTDGASASGPGPESS